jgi:hypothetical protein
MGWVTITGTAVHRRLVVDCVGVARGAHRPTSDGRNSTLLVDSRFRVHALFWADVAKLRVIGWLHEMLGLLRRAGVVADEMQVLTVVRRDRERLLHQTIRLVTVAIRSAVGVLLIAGCRGCLTGVLVETTAATSLALHFTVRQETARYTAGTPRFAVGPSAHASLALVPYEH